MSKELKPCPFCGMTPTVELTKSGMISRFICPPYSSCVSSGLFVWCKAGDEERAIEAWNRRVEGPTSTPSNKADVMADEARKRVSGYTAKKKAELEASGRVALKQASTPSGQGGEGMRTRLGPHVNTAKPYALFTCTGCIALNCAAYIGGPSGELGWEYTCNHPQAPSAPWIGWDGDVETPSWCPAMPHSKALGASEADQRNNGANERKDAP